MEDRKEKNRVEPIVSSLSDPATHPQNPNGALMSWVNSDQLPMGQNPAMDTAKLLAAKAPKPEIVLGPNERKIGRYILGKSIGEGTFGKVKIGTHMTTGEKVAVKILEKTKITDVADVERVSREIHILKVVQHPHVV